MNKHEEYQEALDFYWKVYEEHHLGMLARHYIDILKELVDQQAILEEYNVTPEILREVLLTGQMFRNQPTLLECIKEWNEKGFDVDVYALEIVIYNYSTVDKEEDEIEISIRIDLKTISYTNDVELSFDLHRLLSKTIKAWEKMKNE